MAEIYKIEAPVGVSLEQDPVHTAGANVWDDVHNVSFHNGSTHKVEGYEKGLGDALVVPEVLQPLREQDSYWWTYVGNIGSDENPSWKFYQIQTATTHLDVTPTVPADTDFPEGTYRWTGDTMNGVPYVTNGVPYVWDQGTSRFKMMENVPRHNAVLPGDNDGDPRVRFNTIRTFRNFMIGMNFYTDSYAGAVSEGWGPWGAARHDNGVWWSHFVTGKNVDEVWYDADPLKSSGWNFLGGIGGPLVDGKAMRDSFILYRERSVWQMIYTGGVAVFTFKELFNDAGLLGVDCVSEIEGRHLVVGQSDVYMHDGVQKRSIADGKVRKPLFERIHKDHQDKVFIVSDYQNKEAWICIPDNTKVTDNESYKGECTTAFVYDWANDAWSIRDIPNVTSSTYAILDAAFEDVGWYAIEEGGPGSNLPNDPLPTPQPAGSSWAEATGSWASTAVKYNPAEWGIAMGSMDGEIYTANKASLFDGENFEAYVEKYGIDFGSPWVTKHISRITPLVRNGVVDIYGTTSMPADVEASDWNYLGKFDSTKDTHLACRLAGRYLGVRFEIPETSRAEIKGFEVEFKPQGRR